MDDDFRKAALDYHRLPRPGKLAIEPTKRWPPSATSRWPIRPASPPPARRSSADPDTRVRLHRARQPGRRDLQRHRRARSGQYRRAGRQAGDGGQGRPVQEIRRHRRVRHRGGRRRTRSASATWWPRWSPPSARINLEDIKAPECFAIEAEAARAHGHPGLPRRPARHRDHRRRRGAQRAAAAGQGAVRGEAGHLRRRRRRAGLRRSAGVDGTAAGERDADRHQGRGACRPRPGMLPNMARYARETDARTLADVLAGADMFLGLSAPRVLKPEMAAETRPTSR